MSFIKSIRTKALLSVLIPILIVLFAVAIITLYAYEYEAQEVVKHRDTELARISAARVSDGLSQYSQILQLIACEDDIQSMEPARLSSTLEKAQSQLSVFDAGVVVYDSDGVAFVSQSFVEERQGTIFPISSEFTKVRETLRPVFSNIIEDTYTGEDVILICVPIIGKGSEFKGVLVGMCTLKYSLLGSIVRRGARVQRGPQRLCLFGGWQRTGDLPPPQLRGGKRPDGYSTSHASNRRRDRRCPH